MVILVRGNWESSSENNNSVELYLHIKFPILLVVRKLICCKVFGPVNFLLENKGLDFQ